MNVSKLAGQNPLRSHEEEQSCFGSLLDFKKVIIISTQEQSILFYRNIRHFGRRPSRKFLER